MFGDIMRRQIQQAQESGGVSKSYIIQILYTYITPFKV